MPRPCSVCALQPHERRRIEELLADGNRLSLLARVYGVSKSALHRHWINHAKRGSVAPPPRAGPMIYCPREELEREEKLIQAGAITRPPIW